MPRPDLSAVGILNERPLPRGPLSGYASLTRPTTISPTQGVALGWYVRPRWGRFLHCHVPVAALLGIFCYTDGVKLALEQQALARSLHIKVLRRPEWYF